MNVSVDLKTSHKFLDSLLCSANTPHFVFVFFNLLMISFFQKRDIQLLKAYMRAIRSANPNLQNLEESIEYNEILE